MLTGSSLRTGVCQSTVTGIPPGTVYDYKTEVEDNNKKLYRLCSGGYEPQ